MSIYRNNLKNREFGKEAPQNCDSETRSLAGRQGASENHNSAGKPTQPKTDSSSCFGISTVISFCSNDARFLGKCIEEAKHFSKEIIVPVADHFFNGMPENMELLHAVYARHPDVQFLQFPYSHTKLYPPYLPYHPNDEEWSAHWNSLARLLGFYAAKSEWILFLDTDEIVDGVAFQKSLPLFAEYDAIRLACYYYVLKPNIRATQLQELTLLAKRKSLMPKYFYQRDERYGLFRQIVGKKAKALRGRHGPLVHHYSWVRPKTETLTKVTTWSHRLDRNWPEWVQKLHLEGLSALAGQSFEEVSDVFFDPLQVELPPPTSQKTFPNVKMVTNFLKLELMWDELIPVPSSDTI